MGVSSGDAIDFNNENFDFFLWMSIESVEKRNSYINFFNMF